MRLIAGEIPPGSWIYGRKQEGRGGTGDGGCSRGGSRSKVWAVPSVQPPAGGAARLRRNLCCLQKPVPSSPPSSSQNKVRAARLVCFLKLNLGSWAEAELGEAVTSARELAGPHALTVLRGP